MNEQNIPMVIRKAFEEGERAAKSGERIHLSWFDFFEFDKDPFFIIPITKETLSLFTDRLELIEKLAKLIGYSINLDMSYHVALIGVKGVGKSSILNLLHNYASERYNGVLYNITTGKGYDGEEKNISIWHPKLDYQYVFIDEISSPKIALDLIKLYFSGKTRIIISSWAPEHFKNTKILVNEKIIVPPFKKSDLIDLFEKRIKWANGTMDSVESEALDLAIEYSLGIPYLFLRIMKDCYIEAYQRKINKVTKKIVEHIITKNYQVLKLDYEDLTTLERKICTLLLEKDLEIIGIGELSLNLEIERPLAWKYLERLKNKGILRKKYEGKKVKYLLNEIAKIKLELMLIEGESE